LPATTAFKVAEAAAAAAAAATAAAATLPYGVLLPGSAVWVAYTPPGSFDELTDNDGTVDT